MKDNLDRFREGLENDLATPVALSAFQKESAGKGRKASEALAAIFRMDKVISLDVIKNAFAVIESQKSESVVDSHEGDPEADEINKLVQERTDAKKNKDFAKADKIRDDLAARGIVIIDTPNGPTWKRN